MMRRAVASASFLLRKKENIGAPTQDTPDRSRPNVPIGRGRPREKSGISTGALAFSRGIGGSWGNAASHHKRRTTHSKGAQNRDCAPFPTFPLTPGISNSDDEIAAG